MLITSPSTQPQQSSLPLTSTRTSAFLSGRRNDTRSTPGVRRHFADISTRELSALFSVTTETGPYALAKPSSFMLLPGANHSRDAP